MCYNALNSSKIFLKFLELIEGTYEGTYCLPTSIAESESWIIKKALLLDFWQITLMCQNWFGMKSSVDPPEY